MVMLHGSVLIWRGMLTMSTRWLLLLLMEAGSLLLMLISRDTKYMTMLLVLSWSLLLVYMLHRGTRLMTRRHCHMAIWGYHLLLSYTDYNTSSLILVDHLMRPRGRR